MSYSAAKGFLQEYRQKQIRWRIHLILGSLIILFAIIALRLTDLHILKGEKFAKQADHQHFKSMEIKAERGTILDRNGRILAIDHKTPSIFAVPSLIKNPRSISRRLAPFLDRNISQISKRLKKQGHFVWLERKLDPAKAQAIRRLEIDGIGQVMESRRSYPKRILMGQLLGFTGLDHQGMEGIEYHYDAILKGQEGRIRFEQDASGKVVFPKGFDYIAPSRGKDLVVTVDEYLQHISERELDAVLARTKAKAGSVVMMDPYTGEVLALVIRPAFNPNTMPGSSPARKDQSPEQWRNRAITDVYEPGSTFKIVAASAALQEGVVRPSEVIDCEEGKYIGAGGRVRDPKPHGLLSFRQVMARSSNIGIAKVAMRMKNDTFYRYIRAFGFGEKTGIDLPGEVPGLVRDPQQWSGRSLATLSFGQEIGVTPMQMITAVSVIANGGLLMRPLLVREIRDSQGDAVKPFSPQTRRRVLTAEVAQQMKEILQGVTAPGGSGHMAALSGYRVAGKTGTAQKIDSSTGRYSSNRYISSFVGFVPAHKPRFALLVVVDEPQGAYWGSVVAAPVFKAIAQEALTYFGVPPGDEDRVLVADARGL